MVLVTRSPNRITLKGHAGYAQQGEDIVCAAVSILAQTLIKSVEDLTTGKIQYSISPGSVDIKHGNLSASAQTLMDSFFIGIRMIADEYPDNVRIAQAFKA